MLNNMDKAPDLQRYYAAGGGIFARQSHDGRVVDGLDRFGQAGPEFIIRQINRQAFG
jgi:hypothetical protein